MQLVSTPSVFAVLTRREHGLLGDRLRTYRVDIDPTGDRDGMRVAASRTTHSNFIGDRVRERSWMDRAGSGTTAAALLDAVVGADGLVAASSRTGGPAQGRPDTLTLHVRAHDGAAARQRTISLNDPLLASPGAWSDALRALLELAA